MSNVKTVPPDKIEDLGSEISQHLRLKDGDSLVLIEGDDFVLVKRAAISRVDRFEKLSLETRMKLERLGVGPEEAERAVRWARESS